MGPGLAKSDSSVHYIIFNYFSFLTIIFLCNSEYAGEAKMAQAKQALLDLEDTCRLIAAELDRLDQSIMPSPATQEDMVDDKENPMIINVTPAQYNLTKKYFLIFEVLIPVFSS